jgi:DNA-directed RNA polymerase II subunit RPB2
VRSQSEENSKPPQQFKLNIEKVERGGRIKANIPKIRAEIPVVILFRALGCETDKDILNMVLSDP